MFRHPPVAVLGMLMLALTGCSQSQHIAPPDAQGQACVRQCSDSRQRCRSSKEQSFKEFNGRYDVQTQGYQNCLHLTQGPQCTQLCPLPTAPDSLDYSTCTQVYDNCVVTCGGRIERAK